MAGENFFGKHKFPGTYIAFEGTEGNGKSTQTYWLAKHLEESGISVVRTFEPGGTSVANAIRELLLNKHDIKIDPLTEVYLFAAARGQLLREVVGPALLRGQVVISDRSFFSNLAYQGFGRKLGWQTVWELNKQAVGNIVPDLIILPEISPEEGLERIRGKRRRKMDRLDAEGIDFHHRVCLGYDFLKQTFSDLFFYLDGNLGRERQSRLIAERTFVLLKERGFLTEGAILRERG